MEYRIEKAPEFALLTVKIPRGEFLRVEASAMAAMDTHLKMKTKLKGGLNRFLSKESVFINEFHAEEATGEISIAPGPAGDIGHYELKSGEVFYLTASTFVAATAGVELDTKFQGVAKGLFSGESFFLIRCTGEGHVWFNTYGALFPIDIRDNYVVDTGHIVAFSEGLEYDITKLGGYKSFFFSGEGFVCRFRGNGKIWIQTKNGQALIGWADRFRIVQNRKN